MLEASNTRANNPPLNSANNSAAKQAAENQAKTSPTKKEISFPEFKDPHDIKLGESAKKAIHQAGEDFQKSLGLDPKQMEAEAKAEEAKANNPKPDSIWSSLKKQEWIHWINRNLFDDDCFARKILSLENELAEGLDPTFEQLKAPKWFRNGFYRVLWGMTFVTTGFRSLYEAIDKESGIAALKKVVQDGVSVVALTTITARAMNWLQEKIYSAMGMPLLIKNTVRPALTVGACVKGIEYFDMVGEPAGEYAVKLAEKFMGSKAGEKSKELLKQMPTVNL